MADRIVTNTFLEKNGNTLFLVNKSQNWSPRHVNDAISDIEKNTHKYYVNNLNTEVGVVNEGGNKFLRTFRDNNLGNNLDSIEDASVYLPEFIGDYPDNKETSWSHQLQGVTHSRDHWFFTQLEKIHKFHISLDLNNDRSTLTLDMPSELKTIGCDHFGDPEYYAFNGVGYLFIPVENCYGGSLVSVFRDDDSLTFIGSNTLSMQTPPDTDRAGWVAINPNNNLIYSSSSKINATNPVYRYSIDFIQLEQGVVEFEFVDELLLHKRNNDVFEINTYIQGGCFTPNGILCMAYGKTYLPDEVTVLGIVGGFLGGVVGIIAGSALGVLINKVFNNTEDNALVGMSLFNNEGIHIHTSSRDKNPFKYEVHPVVPDAQEVEGMCYWDLDDPNNQSEKIEGNIHAILLNKRTGILGNDDKFWLKHYRI